MQAVPDIQILPLSRIEHLDAVVDLQRNIWGYGDLEVEGRAILTVASRFSGQVLGAFAGSSLVGFSLAFAALQQGRLHSHRVGVLPDFQNAGVGRALKLAQREHAMKLGFSVIQWSFDPLRSRNAYFNLCKLGGLAKTYITNLYGITSSPLHGGLPTDRLLIEWDLESERVGRAVAGLSLPAAKTELRLFLAPGEQRLQPEVQQRLRAEFMEAFAAGYVLTGFNPHADQEFYTLEKS